MTKAKNPKKGEKKQHFWLFSTHVVFTDGTGEKMGNAPILATVYNNRNCVPAAKIQEAQQQAQYLFHERSAFAGQGLNVLDVFILAISYLGHMTESEFNELPEGVAAKQEQRPETPVAEIGTERKSSIPADLN